ncbi:ABC transporter substrate-binding protein [Planctomonas psychrotolerans]|uniref:ABC transporter substrate-binding protein n=1 Tax=Planctomonas psychrotolerans TaxID=2528712 RepID=UPI00123BF131|nr:ABC transporter substrate-binding protein [Planctomonas psychrotolerans]
MFRNVPARRKGAALAASAAVAALLLSGCSASESGTSNGSSSGSDADTLIAYTGQAGDYQINFNPYSPSTIGGVGEIFEPLFYYNQLQPGEPKPMLGTEFSWNEDGTELSITTREGVTFTDGEPFTAEDVAFNLNLLKENPAINAIGFSGEVTVVDDTHLTIAFSEPAFVDGPSILGRTYIVPEHIWSDVDPATDVVAEPVGTGPYMLSDFKAQAFTYTANPDYWGGEPAVKNVRYIALSGNQAGADALAAGTIDWQTGPVPDMANVEENYPGYKAITVHLNQPALFTCSNAELGCEGPQTDPAVRQALYYAMDREQINSLAFQNTAAEISPGFALPERDAEIISDSLEEPIAPMSPDADRASSILEAAGYAKGSDGIYAKDGERVAMSVRVVTGWTDYITAVDLIAQQAKAAGIEITAQQSSWNEWTEVRGLGEYQLLIDSLGQGPAADPYYMYNEFFSTANTAPVGTNANPGFARFSDPEVDAALAALKASNPTDTEARQPHYDVIQNKIAESLPYIPILVGGTTSEYNAAKFDGWPTQDDLYAFPAIWARPDSSQIFMSLTPTGE